MKIGIKSVAVMWLGMAAMSASASDDGVQLPVFPAPQSAAYRNGETELFQLDSSVSVLLDDVCATNELIGVEALERDTGSRFKRMDAKHLENCAGERILIAGKSSLIAKLARHGVFKEELNKLAGIKECPAEGYRLLVDKNVAIVAGSDDAGTFYGLQTLRQLVRRDKGGSFAIPKIAIRDYPDLKVRGQLSCSLDCSTGKLGFWREAKDNSEVVEYLASQRCNFLYVYLRGLEKDAPNAMTNVSMAFDALRAHHIEPVPILLVDQYVLTKDGSCAEGMFQESKEFRFDGELATRIDFAASTPKLADPSFEKLDANGRLEEWSLSCTPSGRIEVRKGEPNAACNALAMTSKGSGYLRAWQDVECEPDSWYALQCDAKSSGSSKASLSAWGLGAYDDAWGTPKIGPPKEDCERNLCAFPLSSISAGGCKGWEMFEGKAFYSFNNKRVRIFISFNGIGQAWIANAKMTPTKVKEVPGIANLIVGKDSPVVVKNQEGEVLSEGADYELIPGKTAFPFSDKNAPWQIKRLEGGRIKPGGSVRISYNFARNGVNVPCPMEPQYSVLAKPLVQKIVRELNLNYIHLDYNEPSGGCSDSRCLATHESAGALLARHVNEFYGYVKEAKPSCQVAMWSLDRWHANAGMGFESLYDKIPKDVIISAYVYQGDPAAIEKMRWLLTYFPSKGFRTTGSPWFDLRNNYHWCKEIYRMQKSSPGILGVFSTNWNRPRGVGESGVPVAMEYGWSVGKPSEELFEEIVRMYEFLASLDIPWMEPSEADVEKLLKSHGKGQVQALKDNCAKYVAMIQRAYPVEFSCLLERHPMYRISDMKSVMGFCDKILSKQSIEEGSR